MRAAAASNDEEDRRKRTTTFEEVCEEVCREMRRYGWSREFCTPRCVAAETERVRRLNAADEAERARGDGGGSRWPFV